MMCKYMYVCGVTGVELCLPFIVEYTHIYKILRYFVAQLPMEYVVL